MSETPSICRDCPNPPETPGVCGGVIVYVKEAAELRDFKGDDTVRAQSIGSSALERVCGARFVPEENTLVEEPREDGEPRYAVKVSDKLSSMDDEHKKAVIASMRDDIQQRQASASKPAPLMPSKPNLKEVKATPQAQLWAELSEFVFDESIGALTNGCLDALDNATDLINDALSTSQYQAEVLAFCQTVREHLNDVFTTERTFKDHVSTYLASDISDNSGAVPETARIYTTWTQTRERLPVETSEITHISAVVMQLARAADTLHEGGFGDLRHVAETRNSYFFAVSQGSSNETIGHANGASAHVLSASSKALQAVNGLLLKLDEVADRLYR